jgi:TRAP transporter TAXI family solute receptor
MVMGDVAVAGFEGSGKFEGKKNDILTLAMLYPNLLQMETLKSSGITDVMRLKGRKISTGSPGNGTNFMTEAVLKSLGLTPDDYTDSRLSFTENTNALRDGTIDVVPCR